MRAPRETLHLLLATALQLIGCAAKAPQPQTKGTHPLGEVIQWMEVYNRSFCQPKEMLVPVSEEHPAEVEHLLAPSCVPLRRCAGCCADEGLQCVPTRMHVVVMEVMKTRYLYSHLDQLAFVEHSACECRPKTNSKVNPERPSCPPCSDKRRRQDPQTCQCRCRRRSQHCQDRGLELNEHSCSHSVLPRGVRSCADDLMGEGGDLGPASPLPPPSPALHWIQNKTLALSAPCWRGAQGRRARLPWNGPDERTPGTMLGGQTPLSTAWTGPVRRGCILHGLSWTGAARSRGPSETRADGFQGPSRIGVQILRPLQDSGSQIPLMPTKAAPALLARLSSPRRYLKFHTHPSLPRSSPNPFNLILALTFLSIPPDQTLFPCRSQGEAEHQLEDPPGARPAAVTARTLVSGSKAIKRMRHDGPQSCERTTPANTYRGRGSVPHSQDSPDWKGLLFRGAPYILHWLGRSSLEEVLCCGGEEGWRGNPWGLLAFHL
ncbi:vascular endothelial growth factor B isoform X3 [Chrysemys picta bellii]|uniref:vascular endothelial growth factor B isoform X3 n=1 Tax=Chrysemys picta bellii TaxID=8478 RepID=UPI0032B2FD14